MSLSGKLVRDRVPEIIASQGDRPIVTVASSDAAYRQRLIAKLHEETDELASPTWESDELEELADILEVVYAFAELCGYTPAHVEQIRAVKAASRGGFAERLVWLGTVLPVCCERDCDASGPHFHDPAGGPAMCAGCLADLASCHAHGCQPDSGGAE